MLLGLNLNTVPQPAVPPQRVPFPPASVAPYRLPAAFLRPTCQEDLLHQDLRMCVERCRSGLELPSAEQRIGYRTEADDEDRSLWAHCILQEKSPLTLRPTVNAAALATRRRTFDCEMGIAVSWVPHILLVAAVAENPRRLGQVP